MVRRSGKEGREVHGIVPLDKPVGMGSNEVLQVVKRLFKARKAGHTGSLDRLASGLLPICLGEATKISGFLLNADKRYRSVFRLGERTTTGDAEGEVLERRPVTFLTQERIEEVLARFRGNIEQIPPMYSALKIQGQRLYRLAHQGMVVERQPRSVTIHELSLLGWGADWLEVDVLCSKGTYIRALAEEIGTGLGCGARIESLRRTQCGPFEEPCMVSLTRLEELEKLGHAALDAVILPMEAGLPAWPSVSLAEEVAYYLCKGQAVMVPHAPTWGWVKIYRERKQFIGVGEVLEDGRIAPRRLLAPYS